MPNQNFTQSQLYKENPIIQKTLEFAIQIVTYSEEPESRKRYVLAKQTLRSGTSIGANVKEAQNAESKADFIHKMKIAVKEADETEYWLSLCKVLPNYPKNAILSNHLIEILKILNSIVGSCKMLSPIR